MALPLVSIVIPCYRQGSLLAQAVDSALTQTYPAAEVIVVNDGSDDETDSVARSFADQIRYVAKPNGGLSSARNAGIAASRGRYSLFLDADDLLHTEALVWLVAVMEERDDRLAVMGWRTFRSHPSEDNAVDHRPPEVDALLPLLLHRNIAPVHAVLCPSILIREAGAFAEHLRACEDWDLWTRLAIRGAQVRTIPQLGAYYRQSAGSMSSDRLRMMEARTETLLRAHASILDRAELLREFGSELADIEEFMIRRLAAYGVASEQSARLHAARRQLRRLGFGKPAGPLERLLGTRAEPVAMRLMRLFAPRRFAYYKSSGD